MARDFSKTLANRISVGNGTFGTLLNGAAKISAHLWARADTFTNSLDVGNRLFTVIINGTVSTGVSMNVDTLTGANDTLSVLARSQTADGLQAKKGTSNLSTGVWYALGCMIDIGGDTITPYVNGVAEGGGAVTFGAATYTHGTPTQPDILGHLSEASVSTGDQWDGLLAEFALWTDDIGLNAFKALARGVDPFHASPVRPKVWLPLWGRHSPEIELIANKVGTITGSVPAGNHAPVASFTSTRWPSSSFSAPAAAGVPRHMMHYSRLRAA